VVLTDPSGICSCTLKCASWKPLTASRPDQHRPSTLRQLGIEFGERVYQTAAGDEIPHSPGLPGPLTPLASDHVEQRPGSTPGVCDEVVLTRYVHNDVARESGRRFALLQIIRQEVTRASQRAKRSKWGKRDSDAMMGRSVALREDHGGADGRGL
jgi:hypothetical protein